MNFKCRSCGAECDSAPDDGNAICPKCCPDHDYRYDKLERTWYCWTCGQTPPLDWYAED